MAGRGSKYHHVWHTSVKHTMVFKAILACPVKTSKDEPVVVVVYVRPLSDCTGRLNNEDISRNSTFIYISVAVAVASKQLLLGIIPVF